MRSVIQNRIGRADKDLLATLVGEPFDLQVPIKPLAQYLPFGKPDFSEEEIEAVTRVMRSGWIGMGPETLAFENELATSLDVPHVVTVNSCTSALYLALLLRGVGKGDEVICPSLTWCATANAAVYHGAKPVFCDVDPETLCASPQSILEKVTRRTRAVIVVHFGGFAADVEGIRAALPSRVAIIEDAAHAFGSFYPDGRAVGASGNLTCFSFYANKNLSTGEGGAIALFDGNESDHLRSLRQNGMPINAWSRFSKPKSVLYSNLTELGYKMNFIDLQAAIGRVQLRRQPEFRRLRADIAHLYCDELELLEPRLRFQSEVLHPRHARHLFTVTLPFDRMNAAVAGTLNPHMRELAILVACRETNYDLEWNAHEPSALKAGVDSKVIDMVRRNSAITGIDEQDATVIRFGRQLFTDKKVDSATFAKAVQFFGQRGAMDLVAVMNTYAVSGFYAIAVDEQPPAGKPGLQRSK